MNLFTATQMINDFLDNPLKEQPRLLNKAVDDWSREYGAYVGSINEDTPARIKMNIERLIKMHVKAMAIVIFFRGTDTTISDLLPHDTGDIVANANKVSTSTKQMLKHLYSLSVKPGTIQ